MDTDKKSQDILSFLQKENERLKKENNVFWQTIQRLLEKIEIMENRT